MARADADIVTSARNELLFAAELNGYDLTAGTWIQNQVTCPQAPRHIVMHYLKLNKDGAISLFTAVIRRDPAGPPHTQVRILPVLYHGVPATHIFGSTPTQRELINEVVPPDALAADLASSSGLKNLAFCYAALAGAEPASPGAAAPEEITPILSVSPESKPLGMRFSVVGPDRLMQEWKIEFDRRAQVKSIAVSTKPVVTPQTAAPAAAAAPVTPASPVAPVPQAATAAPVTQAAPVSPVTPAATVEPVQPAASAAPVTPDATVAPVQPAAIAAPVTPAATVEPVQPAAPAAPVTPAAPVAPATPAAPAQKSKWRPVPQGPKPKWHPVPQPKSKDHPIPPAN
jgi:hypothetical protein